MIHGRPLGGRPNAATLLDAFSGVMHTRMEDSDGVHQTGYFFYDQRFS